MNDHAMMSGKVAGIYLGILACAGAARSWTVKPKTAQAPITAAINPARWTAVPLPARAFTLTTHAGCFWAAGAEEMIARSCDGAQSWVLLHWKQKGQPIYELAFTGAQSLFAYGGNGKRWGSRDNGQSWKSKQLGLNQQPLGVHYLNAQYGIEGSGSLKSGSYLRFRLQHSRGWKTLVPPRPASERQTLQAARISSAIINSLCAAALIRPRTFYLTTDGGRHWRTRSLPANMRVLRLTSLHNGYMADVLLTRPLPAQRAMLYSPDGLAWYQLNASFAPRLRHCRHGQCLLDQGWVRLRRTPTGNWQVRGWRLTPSAPDRHLPWAAARNTLCYAANRLHCAQGTPATPAALMYTPAEQQAIAIQRKTTTTMVRIRNIHHHLYLICLAPTYPLKARKLQEMGAVVLHVIFGRDGRIQGMEVKSTVSDLLAHAAFDAARYWRSPPTVIHGRTVRVDSNIHVYFHLSNVY